MQLRQSERKQVKLRLGLSGASGFGKTKSALLLAYGMTNDWNKIAVIDTENSSASLYSDLGNYQV
jgi:adenylylsulfate kinase-like enzyme